MGQVRRLPLYLPGFTLHLLIAHHDAFVGAGWTSGCGDISCHCPQEAEDVAMASRVNNSYCYPGGNSCLYVR